MNDLVDKIRKRNPSSFNSSLILNHFQKSEESVIEKSVVDSFNIMLGF